MAIWNGRDRVVATAIQNDMHPLRTISRGDLLVL
jgi:hypothetical protein